ncbi:hypothetical protein AHAS_Ahas11G0278100 [Arachis hypogaea]
MEKDEISAGIVPMQTIKEVLNMTQETSCWIVGNVVSIEVGKDGWFYTSCKTCLKKVVENKDRGNVLLRCSCKYQLQITVTNGSSCMKLLLWNKEVEQMVGKAAVKVKELCFNEMQANTPITETDDETNGHVAFCLSKLTNLSVVLFIIRFLYAKICDSNEKAPAKRSCVDTCDGSTVKASVSANVQASSNKTFKRNCGKKKMV